MKTVFWRVAVFLMVLPVAGEIPAGAQPASAPSALTLPAAGTFARNGEFTGPISINRFEQRDNKIVAIGMVSGVLSRGGHRLRTAVVGEVVWPVAIRSGGVVLASGQTLGTTSPTRIAWSPDTRSAFRVLPVQAEVCQVVDIALGPINIDVLGAQIALSAVTFNLSGVVGTPLGDLVCAVSDLIGNVAGLVNLLNSLLGLLTGLLGGLTGGLGGAIPVP